MNNFVGIIKVRNRTLFKSLCATYKVNLLLFAGDKIFVERHLQSHLQAQCAFRVMRSTCPFRPDPDPDPDPALHPTPKAQPPPDFLPSHFRGLPKAVVLVFIAFAFWQRQRKRLQFYGLISGLLWLGRPRPSKWLKGTLGGPQRGPRLQLQVQMLRQRAPGWSDIVYLKCHKYKPTTHMA